MSSPLPTPAASTPPTSAKLGRLFLVPAPLDFGCDTQAPLQEVLPQSTIQQASQLGHWICENAKSTRAYLKRVDALAPLATPIQAQQMSELPREVHKKGDHGDKGEPVAEKQAEQRPTREEVEQGKEEEEDRARPQAEPGTLQEQVADLAGEISRRRVNRHRGAVSPWSPRRTGSPVPARR